MTRPPSKTPSDTCSEFLMGLSDDEKETLKIMLAMGPKPMERLVRIAAEDEKREWLFALTRKWAAAIAAFITATLLLKDQVASMVRSFWGSP